MRILQRAASRLIGGGVGFGVDCYVGAEIPPAGAPAGFDGTPQAFAQK